MGLIARDLPTLVFALLPGFIAAAVFYTLTAHPKASEFERLIQALIFTVLLKLFTILIRETAFWLGRRVAFGTWTSDTELAWSVILAPFVGIAFAYFANKDAFHTLMRRIGLTTRTSYPSEWYGTFARQKRWVILHLVDGRRLYGWPEEWPDQADKRQFVLDQPEWLLDNNDRAPLYRVELFMVPASDVKMVEFLKENEEVLQEPSEIERAEALLLDAQKEKKDGSERPQPAPNRTQDGTIRLNYGRNDQGPVVTNVEQKGQNGPATTASKPLPSSPPPPPKR